MTMPRTFFFRRISPTALCAWLVLALYAPPAASAAPAQPQDAPPPNLPDALLALAQATSAGTDKPAATLKIQAREVVLPVTVRDKHGALVSSLQKSDFTLTEDGRPQTIVDRTLVALRTAGA